MSQPASNADSLIGQRMGKYELVALVARGGTAEIYLARIDGVAGFEKYVVVKLLHDYLADSGDFVHMFLDEARLTAQLDHSNIVQTLELGEKNGRYYIVMEYLAGMSLSLIARRVSERVPGGRLPVELSLGIAAQACAGLHYAHCKTDASGRPLNIVHRDVSPQNLVVSFEGITKLVDFGIAKAEMRATQTQSGTIKGKFAYMSPEQCLAQDIDHRTDVYALGIIVHELLTGRRLFKRPSTYETYRAIVEGKVPAPSEVNHELDPALDPVVMRALARDREDRYASAEAFGDELTGLLHKRGKAVAAGTIAAFFDRHFSKEIEEHARRMRELMAGRQTIMEELWDDASEDPSGVQEDEEALDDVLPSRDDGALSGLESAIRSAGHGPRLQSSGLAGTDSGTAPDDMDMAATRVELPALEKRSRVGAGGAGTRGEDAGLTDPGHTDAGLTDPGHTDPGQTDPGASSHEAIPTPGTAASGADDSAPVPRPPVVAASLKGPKGRRHGAALDDFSMASMKTSPAGPRGLLRQGKRQQQDTEQVPQLFSEEIARERIDTGAVDEPGEARQAQGHHADSEELPTVLRDAPSGLPSVSPPGLPSVSPSGPHEEPLAAHATPRARPRTDAPPALSSGRHDAPSAPHKAPSGSFAVQRPGPHQLTVPRSNIYPVAAASGDASAELPRWVLVLTFVLCLGFGLGATLLVAHLI